MPVPRCLEPCRTATDPAGSPPAHFIARPERAALAALLLSIALAAPRPAQAQLNGVLTVASDERWRGRSLSTGQPVISANLGYDAPNGLYADGAVTLALQQGGLAVTGASIDTGYAWRTARTLTIDIGFTRRQFTRNFSGGRATGYSEIHAGVSGRSLSARIAYSPDYFVAGLHDIYASMDGVQRLDANWRLTAHAGTNLYLSPIRVPNLGTFEYDAGLGIARRSGPLDLRLDVSFGGPDADYYRGSRHGKTALVASAAFSF